MHKIHAVTASTSKLVRASLRCRYVVVVLEDKYLDTNSAPPPLEIDEFDLQKRTVHIVAMVSRKGNA